MANVYQQNHVTDWQPDLQSGHPISEDWQEINIFRFTNMAYIFASAHYILTITIVIYLCGKNKILIYL